MARLTKHQSFSGLKTTFLRNFDGRECVRVCVRTTTRYLIFSMIIKFFLFSLTRRVELRASNWQWICCLFLLNVLCLSLKAHWTSHPKKRETQNKRQETSLIFFSLFCVEIFAKICFESEAQAFLLSSHMFVSGETCEKIVQVKWLRVASGLMISRDLKTNVLSVYRAIENGQEAGETQKDSKSINLLKKKWTRNCFRL